jgi:hypothetical protein
LGTQTKLNAKSREPQLETLAIPKPAGRAAGGERDDRDQALINSADAANASPNRPADRYRSTSSLIIGKNVMLIKFTRDEPSDSFLLRFRWERSATAFSRSCDERGLDA